MNKSTIYILKGLRKLYAKAFRVPSLPKPACEQDPLAVSRIIYDKLIDDKPCMIARFGSTELVTLVNYLGVKQSDRSILKYIQGRSLPWWWHEGIMDQIQRWSGFFPPTQNKIEQFCELMLEDMKEVDVLGSWLSDESYIEARCSYIKVRLILMEPFWTNLSWMRALEGKKVLIIHPFAETIRMQYGKRHFLFDNPTVLPEFSSLKIIKAVQTLGRSDDRFEDWFDALESMKNEIDKTDFEFALIGCGAYGFPLAAYVKRIGKKSIHLGGALQLLFGIKGNRWENEDFGEQTFGKKGVYKALMNEYWVKPMVVEKPKSAENVESECYW